MRWSSFMGFSFLMSFKQLHRKDCTLPVNSSSSHLPDVVACDICIGLMPQGFCCGIPLRGNICDPDGVGSVKKVLACWNVSLFFCRSSGVALSVALCTHFGPIFFLASYDVLLLEAPLRVTILTLGSCSFCSGEISWIFWFIAGLSSLILDINIGHSSIVWS